MLHQLMYWLSADGITELVRTYGIPAIAAIVFAETGLLVGFFLPGDSLLVTAGIVAASAGSTINIWLMLAVVAIAAIVGDAVGFFIGSRLGPALFKKDDSLLFKKKHIERAHAFYERYGGKTIVLARFVPIVRTFAPTVAGAAGMNYRSFLRFNVFGGIGWVASMLLFGFYGAKRIDAHFGEGTVRRYLQPIILAVVALSFVPGIVEILRERRRLAREASPAVAEKDPS